MNKHLSVLMAICFIFATFGSVVAEDAAQPKTDIADYPAIDVDVAADYLGDWYLREMCLSEGACMGTSIIGIDSVITFNEDNTVVTRYSDDEADTSTSYWYMEDGKVIVVDNETKNTGSLGEDGILSIDFEKGSMRLEREPEPADTFGDGELKSDASFEDFKGVWYIRSLVLGDEKIPAGFFGLDVSLDFQEDKVVLDIAGQETKEVSYEINEGILTFDANSNDPNETEPDPWTLEYHMDDTLVSTLNGERNMILVREENRDTTDYNALYSNVFSALGDAEAENGPEGSDVGAPAEEVIPDVNVSEEAVTEALH